MFPIRQTDLIALISLVVVVLAAPERLRAVGGLIPLTERRVMLFDNSGQHLYSSASDGFVRRYNGATAQLEASYNLGGIVNGIDITRDDSFLLVAQQLVSASQGTVHKVNSSTGAITNVNYTRDSDRRRGVGCCSRIEWSRTRDDPGLRVCASDQSGHQCDYRTDRCARLRR